MPSVTALADGGWLVTWASDSQDGSGDGIYQQRYDKDGGTVGNEAALKKGSFALEKAKDKDDYLIYSKKTGTLSYDADGSGTKVKPVEIALLTKGLNLKATDFFVI